MVEYVRKYEFLGKNVIPDFRENDYKDKMLPERFGNIRKIEYDIR